MPHSITRNNKVSYLLDRNKQAVYSDFIRRAGLQLPEFVRLHRGESIQDSRPNKALEDLSHLHAWEKYRYRDRWSRIAQHGVVPEWRATFKAQSKAPPNHGSATRALNIIIKHLRAGQDTNRYLILDIDLLLALEGVTCSPFGAVQKGEVDLEIDARIIHDLSYPPGESVNDNTVPDDEVDVSYDGAEALVNRILDVAEVFPTLQRMMTDDVNGAFRNIQMSADHVGCFAGTIPELGVLVVDLCCPFGWRNSPSSYWIAGAAISHLYSSSAPQWPLQPKEATDNFDAKTWCDDHTAIEPNGKALGLEWDLPAGTVSMPREKVFMALNRLRTTRSRVKTTKTELQKLLGSLRHVATCIRTAIPFFQRIAALARSAPRHGGVVVSREAKDDMCWIEVILRIGRLNGIPLARFTRRHEPDFHIHMDASDQGLCALFPAQKQYLQVRFTDDELTLIRHCNDTGDSDFCINVRELMSAVFASIVWGPAWKHIQGDNDTHVKFWNDNTSAASRNSFAQLLLRVLGICEVQHGFYSTASHVAGVDNEIADAGSRVWESPSLARRFANLCCGWTCVQIPTGYRNLSLLWERCYAQERSLNHLGSTILEPGSNGPRGAA
ncbi:hypothetical protein PHYSODRAFT_484312 [Phytophthora sojae]|uniref:Cleavage induced protein n=1 Tax=Phytophthora sojae (strain P6497) TaxID=1094619 RepID=G4Z080_PHYSP|nr:hypothetical protein PHYSODRAFT_484312 [Phytophthora sojae]EGZ24637.1 hypothetical protein PHYSODRAFT_484312 [Phytophthora sojae]|eukprot:XP_009519925.1 hypothetical protein PHYSODRAFT_484312 [Phytophthora sojae]